jgi:Tol biopolymer transport system component
MLLVRMAVNGMEIGAKETLGFVTEPVWELRTSPAENLALVVYGQLYTGDKLPAKIGVFSLDPSSGKGCMISNNAALYPDWTRDGRSVVYAEGYVVTEANNDNSLGKIRQATLVDNAGKVLWSQLTLEDLADILMNTQTCVRTLTDCRILFSSPEATLPSGINDHIRQVNLYSLDAQKRSTPARMIPHSEMLNMGGYLWAFEVSPDERRITFVTEGGRIAFMELASGSVHFIQNEALQNEQICTLPSWRSPDDICFDQRLPGLNQTGTV